MNSCSVDCTQALEDLRESEERFRIVFDFAPIGMALTNPEGHFTRVNSALTQLLSYSPEEFEQLTLRELVAAEDAARLVAAFTTLLSGQDQRRSLEVCLYCKGGAIREVMLVIALVRGSANQPLYFIGQFIDITERKQSEKVMKHLAYHDPLTGLPNRMLFRDHLTVALAHARANEDMLAVVFLDLDRFKEINDTLGHYVGDKALKLIAERLGSAVRKSDVIARLGGDEFTLLLHSIPSRKSVAMVIDKIIKVLEQPLIFEGREFIVSASVGVALFPEDAREVDTLLQIADKYMYFDKRRKGVER